ncbi:tRNA-splicing endonuclease subunit Sen34 isoform X2 [Episyrphus balteatus]|uniref:tRNA-splicing endonuclease subunit Sen34 isoform X2 n=1 Tax=Episyrphus balteatus TaxID=286459 RepID=UPI002486B71D|nr:tRNA-splicing endonuclease subunit Sen34 isoform X2 [Episyrphus balteatus]
MDPKENKIILTYLNGTGFIFNSKVRKNHRIIGSMVGTSCSRGWSGNSTCLPVELTKYETQLLIEKGIAELVSKTESLLRPPTEEDVEMYKKETESRLQSQEEHLKDGKVKESLHYIDKIIYGKRKKLLKSGVLEKDIKLSKEEVLQEIRDSVQYDRKNALVEIHCEHPRIHEGTLMTLPEDNSLKYRVFKDFWERGKFVTCGEAFGADFIVYPGDPIVFHASHIVIVLDKPTINPLQLIAKVRLSVIVNKLCVFAYEGKEGELSYQTVQWEGNKDDRKL